MAQKRPLRRLRSFKVTNFGTDRKPVCEFLLVNTTNLHPISHRFRVIAKYWSNYCFLQGVHLFNAFVLDELINSRPRNKLQLSHYWLTYVRSGTAPLSTFHIHIHSIQSIHPFSIQFKLSHTHHSHTSIIFLKNCPNSFISSNFIPQNYS